MTNTDGAEYSTLTLCGESDDWNVSYDPDTATLTLRDAELFSNCAGYMGSHRSEENHLIYVVMNHDMNLVLLGENTCSFNPVMQNSYGYYQTGMYMDCGTLTISGGGSLAVSTAPEADLTNDKAFLSALWANDMLLTDGTSLSIDIPDAPNASVRGIFYGGDLTIDDGSLTVNIGDTERVTGIDADTQVIEIRKGSLTVITGDSSSSSTSLFAGAVVMSGGTLTAIGGNNTAAIVLDGDGKDIYTEGINITGGTLTAIGPLSALISGDLPINVDENISVLVNEQPTVEGATEWDGVTPLGDDSPYKCIIMTDIKQVNEVNYAWLDGLLPILGSQLQSPFVDVTAVDYYYDAVNWAVDNGITTGTGRLSFSPDEPCTRAQAVTFLWRAAGSPAPKSNVTAFVDVDSSAYYAKAVAWAVETGVTNGTSATTFSPDESCTRAQIVTFLYRAFGSATEAAVPFTDVASGAYYAPAVAWAAANGVTGGTTAATFSPAATCTRAQIVTFLYRACK